MIPYIYIPVLFSIGPINIYTWGSIVALGFLISILLARKYSKIEERHLYNISLIAIIWGIIGGRILYFAYQPSEFGFYNFFRIWNGGMSIFGGIIFSALFIILYLKWQKLNILKTADELSPWIVLGFAIGRIGCLIGDGGHLGKSTNFFLGTMVNGVVRHWTALYSFISLSILFVILLLLKKNYSIKRGFLFSFFLIYYGISRFIVDMFRVDPVFYGLTIAQYLSIMNFFIGIIILRRILK